MAPHGPISDSQNRPDGAESPYENGRSALLIVLTVVVVLALVLAYFL
ncbi:hypothetical protein SAMN05216559_0966 [Halomicrobium zhouii]|uniref:Flagellin N-terminal-like domain-containing protein n=1 Tax=Halomicrobium zhouii TaxID=767519 RepID=A0A1I6KKI2_9EURY|nr:hypothetical protein [Halomicrobium zhouii]SFR91772.1 hypothetical protein SAMN05216559_0966 [Halomicrobium zhouii]